MQKDIWARIHYFYDSSNPLSYLLNHYESRGFALIGSKGGKTSLRVLTPEQARKMVEAREAKKKGIII